MTTLRNFTIAAAAIISPFWLDILKDASKLGSFSRYIVRSLCSGRFYGEHKMIEEAR
jgi:hypothetical protein